MRFPRTLGPVLTACLGAAACGRSGVEAFERNTPSIPLPVPRVSPVPAPPPLDSGDGHDGPLTVSTILVINTCHAVTTGDAAGITLDDTSGVLPGTRLVVIQIQDDFAISGDPGDLVTPGSAGLWEIVRATTVGPVVNSAPPLTHSYSSSGTRRAQACTVPEFTDVTVTASGELRAAPWDGQRGGLVALFADGTLSVAGGVTASGAGFRGGQPSGNDGTAGGVTDLDTVAGVGGGKGEGLDGRAFSTPLFGRGNLANGGGGGNRHNAGGAGGGAGGTGGAGGIERDSAPDTGGLPGARLVASWTAHLSPGGGGGAGHENDGAGGPGGHGGGLVLLSARRWAAAPGRISADGMPGSASLDPGTGSDPDGAGGGGAGGTIVASSLEAATFDGEISVRGGRGGDVDEDGGTADPPRGPGGGGGGGRAVVIGLVASMVVTSGGEPGLNVQDGTPTAGPWGAGRGADGVVDMGPSPR